MAGFPKENRLGDKAKAPRPGIPLVKDDLLKLILQERGNLSRVADRLGTTRTAVRKRCQNDSELGEALEEARERKLDALEDSVWLRAEESNDTGLQCFILKTQGRHRGYDQDDNKNMAKDIASAAFEFIVNKSKNPAEPSST
jgi:transposase-like protein